MPAASVCEKRSSSSAAAESIGSTDGEGVPLGAGSSGAGGALVGVSCSADGAVSTAVGSTGGTEGLGRGPVTAYTVKPVISIPRAAPSIMRPTVISTPNTRSAPAVNDEIYHGRPSGRSSISRVTAGGR